MRVREERRGENFSPALLSICFLSCTANQVVLKKRNMKTELLFFFFPKCFSEYSVRSWNLHAIDIEGKIKQEGGEIRKEALPCQFLTLWILFLPYR